MSMTHTQYRSWTLADMQRGRWRTTRDLENGYVMIPAGTVVEITGKHGGLGLRAEPCGACGVAVHIRKANPSDVEQISADEPDVRRSAAERVRRFVSLWKGMRDRRGCPVYSLGIAPGVDPVDLTIDDLAILSAVDAPRRATRFE